MSTNWKMQSTGVRRELFTSLAGTAPLIDVLTDLPLPTHLPTPMEQHTLGKMGLKGDSTKWLNNVDPALCTKISQALMSVDSSFLELKENVQTVPYVPDSTAPLLIRSVVRNGPVVRIKKLDPAKYSSPVKVQAASSKASDAVVPLQAIQDPRQLQQPDAKKKKKRLKRPSASLTPAPDSSRLTTKAPSENSSSSAVPVPSSGRSKRSRSSSSSSVEPKQKKRGGDALLVSIDRTQVEGQQQKLVPGSGIRVKKRRQLDTKDSSAKDVAGKEKMTVRVSRNKLKGGFGKRPQPIDTSAAMMLGFEEDLGLEESFTLAAGVSDQVVPSNGYPGHHKVKRKKHHSRGDPAKVASLHRFASMLESLLEHEDQLCSDDYLFNRHLVVQLVSDIAKLKQQGILSEVPVEGLVKLMWIMDKHILDTAELQMNVLPDDVEAEPRVWRELAKERILRSIDAAQVILHITTAPNMPKNVYLEESIEQIISMTKFHLDNNVYPQFDPVYRAENKEIGMLPRQKRRYASHSAGKDTMAVYHNLTQVVETLALLLESQPLTDTTVLQLSSLGICPFFVENVSSLQLSALRLVRAIFSRYEKHRELILEDIFASLARLPTTKRNLRNFRLSNSQSIQMVTALILQLVQCIVVLPTKENQSNVPPSRPDTPTGSESGEDRGEGQRGQVDPDVQMINSYELALRTGKNFLSTFLKKCCSSKDEDDFRPLFDNFVQDLLTTLNLPEWPASELLLTLLGMLLVRSFSNRSNEQSLRLTSLDHLGVIAARLRKDAATSIEQDHEELINILAQVLQSKLDRSSPSPTAMKRLVYFILEVMKYWWWEWPVNEDAFSENNQHLQKALIAYLNMRSEKDPACAYARDFYIGQWLRDSQLELEKALQGNPDSPTDPMTLDEGDDPGISSSAVILQQAEVKKEMLHSLMEAKTLTRLKSLESILDERSAATVTRSLASSRALSKSFDKYLHQLLRVLNEPAVHVRTRAMKALSTIIAADPSILSRVDMQRAVQCRSMDQSTLVREAAVDLVGRFVLSRPELTLQYYDMLSERILDTGVSVRKRVIKIMKDICVMQPDFPKTSEICVKIIRRIGDEEGIKQLVMSVFRELWFTLPPEGLNQREVLVRRVTNITAVVGSCKEYEWFEQLLEQMLKSGDQGAVKVVLEVCQMMVDCLVENMLTLDENSASGSSSSSPRLVACITTLYLFCKTRPSLLLRHATTLHPYLSSTCASHSDMMVLHYVAQMLKLVLPLMEHPSETFLAGLEEDLIRLIMKHGQMIVQSCVNCLGVVVNSVTHNYVLIRDCFHKFFMCLERVRTLHSHNPQNSQLVAMRPSLLRSVFTVGLICKQFDMDTISPQSTQENPISLRVFSHLMYFSKHEDEEVQLKAVTGLGFFCVQYPELMLEKEAKLLYHEWLTKNCHSKKKCQVLKNLQNHLKEVEMKLKIADTEWKQKGDKENLLEFGDHHSSVSSNIAQAFLLPVLESFFHAEVQVRLAAVQAVVLILRQGLVHPTQCVPYLIAMSTDSESSVKQKADQQLSDHCSRYGHFMQTQLMAGMKKSYEFQQGIAGGVVRGLTDSATSPQSLLGHVYSLIRSNKQHRRAFLRALLRHFENYEKNALGMLLYLADNLAYLPYNTLEEPLFVVHHVDLTISVTGSSLLQQFKEILGSSSGGPAAADDDDEDLHTLSQQSCDVHQLSECCHSSLGCSLLLLLKQHIKKSYGLSDTKCQHYSPNESNKAYDKTVSRKAGVAFEPRLVIEEVKCEALGRRSLKSKDEYLRQYIVFKQLMIKIDPFEVEDEGSDPENISVLPPAPLQERGVQPPQEGEVLQPQQQEAIDHIPAVPPLEPSIPPRRSRSRASSTSSNTSVGSRKSGRSSASGAAKPKKRRRIISSDGSDEDDPDFKA